MESEEIENKLVTLSRRSFRSLVKVILQKAFSFEVTDVDGTGDGGTDWFLSEREGRRLLIAVQDTTQKANIHKKVCTDAEKAKANLDANRFFFFSNRRREFADLVAEEEEIRNMTGMDASVFDGKKMAGLVIGKNLEDDFLAIIGERTTRRRPELPEMCLCAYANLSADRTNHKEEIFRDTLLTSCHSNGKPISREDLISSAIRFLGSDDIQIPFLNRQIDKLLSQQKLQQTSEKLLTLTYQQEREITRSNELYQTDLAELESAQIELLGQKGIKWSPEKAQSSAVLLTRMFLFEQLQILEHAKLSNINHSFARRLGNPEQELRDLLQRSGARGTQIPELVRELAAIARDKALIKKLNRTAVFVVLEGQDPMLSSAALGFRTWSEVSILLDSSVAIPYLCSSVADPVSDYVYSLSWYAIDLFRGLGSNFKICSGHLEECAAHLIRAGRYNAVTEDDRFRGALIQSRNAYVAYYNVLRKESRRPPKTLMDFLMYFSRRVPAAANLKSLSEATFSVLPDIRQLFTQYRIASESAPRINQQRFNALQRAYDFVGGARPEIIKRHDIDALAYLVSCTENNEQSMMMLTWDKIMIDVGQGELPSAFIASPELAVDFAQPCQKLSETQWCSLSHRLAAVASPDEMLTARMIDMLARSHPDKLTDGEFRTRLLSFRDEAYQRVKNSDSLNVHEWLKDSMRRFFASEDIVIPGEDDH